MHFSNMSQSHLGWKFWTHGHSHSHDHGHGHGHGHGWFISYYPPQVHNFKIRTDVREGCLSVCLSSCTAWHENTTKLYSITHPKDGSLDIFSCNLCNNLKNRSPGHLKRCIRACNFWFLVVSCNCAKIMHYTHAYFQHRRRNLCVLAPHTHFALNLAHFSRRFEWI